MKASERKRKNRRELVSQRRQEENERNIKRYNGMGKTKRCKADLETYTDKVNMIQIQK